MLTYIIHGCTFLFPQVFGLSEMHQQKSKVSNPTTTCCSWRNIPTVGLGYQWGYFPTFIKATPLYFYYRSLLHTVDISSSAEASERSRIHQLPTTKIISKFGIPTSLVFQNAMYFSSLKLYEFALEYGIVLKHYTNYYSQGNGLAESTRKNIIRIIKKYHLL